MVIPPGSHMKRLLSQRSPAQQSGRHDSAATTRAEAIFGQFAELADQVMRERACMRARCQGRQDLQGRESGWAAVDAMRGVPWPVGRDARGGGLWWCGGGVGAGAASLDTKVLQLYAPYTQRCTPPGMHPCIHPGGCKERGTDCAGRWRQEMEGMSLKHLAMLLNALSSQPWTPPAAGAREGSGRGRGRGGADQLPRGGGGGGWGRGST